MRNLFKKLPLVAIPIMAILLLVFPAWSRVVIYDVKRTRVAGGTVNSILKNRYSQSPMRWRVGYVENWPFDAKVFCEIHSPTGLILHGWQWDIDWPSSRAITPQTATLFPSLDPHVPLDPSGLGILWHGKGAIPDYF